MVLFQVKPPKFTCVFVQISFTKWWPSKYPLFREPVAITFHRRRVEALDLVQFSKQLSFTTEKMFKQLGASIPITTNKFLAPRRFSNPSTFEKSIFCWLNFIDETQPFNSFMEEREGLNFFWASSWNQDLCSRQCITGDKNIQLQKG